MNDIEQFLQNNVFAVAGASANRAKYGNKVVRAYKQNSRTVHPLNPQMPEIEGLPAFASVADLPDDVNAISVVTPPTVTLQIVREALRRNIKNIWMQPGAEHPEAIRLAVDAGANVIADGSCVLVALGYRENSQ
ncbi:MAG: CoA-binding protein [Deltaproteobacteria bacterium]|nr:CoA-binding protein [Deltaproteobacteria bacterium]